LRPTVNRSSSLMGRMRLPRRLERSPMSSLASLRLTVPTAPVEYGPRSRLAALVAHACAVGG